MNASSARLVVHLDAAGDALTLDGTALENGALVLTRLPVPAVSVEAPAADALAGPAGIAADARGRVYLSDPDAHRLLVLEPCEEEPRPLPCLGGLGSNPGCLRRPAGVAIGPRDVLHVADSGNHRIQAVDLETLQVVGVIGQEDPYATPRPGTGSGRLDDPGDVAVDAAGRLYVADRGNGRIQRFTADGAVDPALWAAIAAQPTVPAAPTHVAVAAFAGVELLLVLDRAPGAAALRVLAYDLDGTLRPGLSEALAALPADEPAGLAAGGDAVYVADPRGRRVLAFAADGSFSGVVPGYRGAVAALAIDGSGRLLLHRGDGSALTFESQGRAEAGRFVLGPLSLPGVSGWGRAHVVTAPLGPGAHLRLLTYAAADAGQPPPVDEWSPGPPDDPHAVVPSGAGEYVWVAGLLAGDGRATPELRAVRVEEAGEGWLRHLPQIYSREEPGRELLERMLALLESFLDEEEQLIADLPRLFDAEAVPEGDRLDWLAGWQSVALDERWSEQQRRRAVRRAFRLHGVRGTADGLRELAQDALGLAVWIDQPADATEPWALGDGLSVLGVSTTLAAAEPGGAVLGTTATLGRAGLEPRERFGAPLFEPSAHRFCVTVLAADIGRPGAREALVELVERERPAHTAWSLRVIEPAARVGRQARLGIDAILGSDGARHRPGDPEPRGRIGHQARLGRDATVT